MTTVAPVFHAELTDKGVVWDQAEIVARSKWIRGLRTRGVQYIDITIKPHKSQRSLDQNAYWWGVPVELVSKFTGYTPDQAHYWLLGEYGGYERTVTGHEVPRIASSKRMNTEEFTKLIDWVLEWAPSTLGIEVPAPGEAEAA